ncbi:hypothetical protein [Nocardioides piscis]|uniref:Peptidase MA-like domain-containing protein n=1 Tax=Nocardioides piscis TaxID=2714938 RepID=A0A6G7YJG8_9ACTN|nr:hypothetical protein [Nocardioides piscis]QIK76893.1 hypothetical protein G7071_17085 [Nocardioides piscis]
MKAGFPRSWVAGLSLFLGLVLLAVVVWVAAGDEPYRADVSRRPATSTAGAGGAAATLQQWVEALESGDAAAAASLTPEQDAQAGQGVEAIVRNVRALGLVDLSARYLDEVGAIGPDGSWTAAVDLSWRIDGFDQEPAQAEVLVDFVSDGDGVAITSVGGGEGVSPMWLGSPLAVRRAPGTLVMAQGADRARAARDYLARVQRAIPVVRRVLPQWRPSVVLAVPASASGLDDALGVADGTYDAIAAVTASADGSGRTGAPVRVFVNPEVSGRLRGAGAQVVISHEVVHVATDANTAVLDPWLLEGFADYVALRDVDLPLDITAARAAASVRRNGVPDHLPGTAEFDPSAGDLQAAYEMAWLACVEVAARAGEDGLVTVYEKASGGADTAEALASVGLTPKGLLAGWQRRLEALE